jgi:carbamoyltransferase
MIKNKIIWGASGGYHDASLCIVKNDELIFASSTERYSRIKNDKNFNSKIVKDALQYGEPDKVIWYENFSKRSLRSSLIDKKLIKFPDLQDMNPFVSRYSFCGHHDSHLSSSLYTCPFETENTLGMVVDSVGEFNTTSFWKIDGVKRKQIHSKKYPNSLGLFYSSITGMLGLKPQEEEYIMMGMSSYGSSQMYYEIFKKYFFDKNYNLKIDLRRGCKNLFSEEVILKDKFEIAFGAQKIFEEILLSWTKEYLHKTKSKKLLLSGGCMLNCLANTKLLDLVDNAWLFPNPGDSGTSVGAALAHCGRKIELKNMFLGHDVGEINDICPIIDTIKNENVVGVINGKAEFGPRSLGNRAILADPRIEDIRNMVNNIKGRELFRPFAPIVLKEYADDIFEMKQESSPYMSYVLKCKKPKLYPSIVHIDGTSRIQTVDKNSGTIYKILKEWFDQTGCPVLLNTSLNIKGKPLLNAKEDSIEFKNASFKIFSP